jgi:uncharacterized protein (TIGR04255 family)
MPPDHPQFDRPPVVETALSLQFTPLVRYTGAHAGWFWKEYLDKLGEGSKQWSQVAEVPKLPDQFERFGNEDVWAPRSVKFVQGLQSPRTQIVRSDGERMIQIQDSRFILNWKKQAGEYPSYDVLVPELRIIIHAFEAFAGEAGFGALQYNQWEVAYVDQLAKGELWETPRDWSKIFPGLTVPPAPVSEAKDETMSADWRFAIPGQRGRLYMSLRQIRIPPSNQEVLNVTYVARGPVSAFHTWEQGLNVGHEAITALFLSMTSREAQAHWKRRT